jgi:hypothetical protein
MASATLSRLSIIGTAGLSAASATVTDGTCTITVKDITRLFVRMTNVSSTIAALVTLGAGADPMVAAGKGALGAITLGGDATSYIGGSWDSAQFKTTGGTIIFTVDSTIGGVTFEAGDLDVY